MNIDPTMEERMERQIAENFLANVVSINKNMRKCILQIRDACFWVTTLKDNEPVTDEEMVLLRIYELIASLIVRLEAGNASAPPIEEEKPKPKIIT